MRLIAKRNAFRAATVCAALLAASTQAFAMGGKEAAPAARPTPANPRVRLATTTSTENSGLLSYLLPFFAEDTGYTVDVVAVGTGAAHGFSHLASMEEARTTGIEFSYIFVASWRRDR